jgi:limonene-1,2-epoxide hydrolase
MRGRENVRNFHKDFGVGSTIKVDWKLESIAQDGNTVLSERMDLFFHQNGSKIVLPTMGSMVVENGIITQWRDYFDLASFEKQAAAFFAS